MKRNNANKTKFSSGMNAKVPSHMAITRQPFKAKPLAVAVSQICRNWQFVNAMYGQR